MGTMEKIVDRRDGDTLSMENRIPHARVRTRLSNDMDTHAASANAVQQVDLNLEKLHRQGMVSPEGGRTVVADEFRTIKRPLIEKICKIHGARHNNLLMVSSALPGEGKTFCAINLAISIAMEMDHTVLLVDADVAKPSIPRYLGIPEKAGLMDVLLDHKLDLADVLLHTNIDRLKLVHAGRSYKHATELLASLAMIRLLDEISQRYPERIIIFDSPPLLVSTEARVLAAQMGQIVLVVEAETTTQNVLKAALSQLGNDQNVSLIYNKSTTANFNNMKKVDNESLREI